MCRFRLRRVQDASRRRVDDGRPSSERSGKYRARYRDPLGRPHSKTFTRKADAERFVREMEVGQGPRQLDRPARRRPCRSRSGPRTFLLLCRRLAPTTQETYRRDLNRYVLPRFGAYRLGRLPADEIENWLNDELAAGLAPSSVHRHYRTLRRMLQSPSRSRSSSATRATESTRRGCRRRDMVFLDWDAGVAARRGPQRALPGADLPRRRHRACAGASSSGCGGRGSISSRGKVRVTEQLTQLEDRLVASAAAEDDRRRPLHHDLGLHDRRPAATTSSGSLSPARTASCSRTPPATHCRRRASGATTSAGPYARPACRAGSTTCGIRASHWRSPTGAHPKAIQARMGHARSRHARPLRAPVPRARRGHRPGVRSPADRGSPAPGFDVVHVNF